MLACSHLKWTKQVYNHLQYNNLDSYFWKVLANSNYFESLMTDFTQLSNKAA